MSILRLAIPSKGRLMVSTKSWFAEQGITVVMSTIEREYTAHILGMPMIEVILMSAGEIPKQLLSGRIDLGVTGQDLVRENIPFWKDTLFELKLLNFGYANLVLAVPKFWVDVDSIDDFDAVAINFRIKNGFRLRIATKYHNLIWSYLRRMGVADYQLVDSQGATEGVIKNNTAEAIADITSSGKTLAANHLKVIGGQPILKSQATLYISNQAKWNSKKYRVLENFLGHLSISKTQIPILKNS